MTSLKDMSTAIDPTKFSLAVSPGNHSKHSAANPHHPQTTAPHFTLPHFFTTQVPQGAAPPARGGQGGSGSSGGTLGSSHSLPASPSRPPAGFAATSLKYFPIAPTPIRARASDDMDLLKRKVPETIQEVKEEIEEVNRDDGGPPPDKRIRLDDRQQQQLQGGVTTLQGQGNGGAGVQLPPGMIAPQLAGPQGVQFTQPGSIQFLPLSLVNPATAHMPPPQGPQQILAAPLSSFLPQSYFAGAPPTMQGVAAAAAVAAAQPNSNQAPPTAVSSAAEMPHRGSSSEG